MKPEINDEIKNILTSAENAHSALCYLHQSLVKSRFIESLDTYRAMADTMLGQYHWCDTHGSEEHQGLFDKIGAEASELYACMAGYAEVFEKLSLLSKNDVAETESTAEINPEELMIPDKIILLVKQNKRGVTESKLRSALKLDRQSLNRFLDALESQGVIKRHFHGNRRTVEIA